MVFLAKYVRKLQFLLANKILIAYHFKYFQNNPTLKAYPTPGVGGR